MQKITKIPIEQILDPPVGQTVDVRGPTWWIVTPDNCVMFCRGSPQCNTNQIIVRKMRDKIYKDCDLVLLDKCYIPVDIQS